MPEDDSIDDLLDDLDTHGDLDRADQAPSIRTESRRYGKPVTIVEGLDLPDEEVADLASELKRSLGTGGTVDDGRIELQGDHDDDRLRELLRDRGFEVGG